MCPPGPDPAPDVDTPASPSRKRATIGRLLKEARQAFSEKGLAGARVDDIARAAGVTKQLVYHYFNSKDQLFASVLDESAQDVLATCWRWNWITCRPRRRCGCCWSMPLTSTATTRP